MADKDHEDEPMEDLAAKVLFDGCMALRLPDKYSPVMFGRFRGIAAIGRGTYGLILRVYDPKLDREVALKLCKVVGDKYRERFLREARLLAQMSHPNIITIHDVGCYESDDKYDGAPFIVMELARGDTGRDLIARRPSWEKCLDFYIGAGRGLAAAHAKKIVHGDFKPSNVLGGDGRARVADFGFACTLGSADKHKKGTPGYLAPEQITGGGNSELADQFAFCVSLWETLEGIRPFDGAHDVWELLGNIDAGEFNVGWSKGVPPGLRVVLARGLSFAPDERWPSMAALVEALEAVRAQPTPQRLRLPKSYLLHTFIGGLIGAMAVMLYIDKPWEEMVVQDTPHDRMVPAEDIDEIEAQELPADAGELSEDLPADREAAEELTEETEGSENEEPEGDEADLCVINDATFHDPSPELRAVCKLIRSGQFTKAEKDWSDVREARCPVSGEKDFDTKLMFVASETHIVVETCRAFASSTDDATLANDALELSKRMDALYKRDTGQLGTSL